VGVQVSPRAPNSLIKKQEQMLKEQLYIICDNSALSNCWKISQKPYDLIESIRSAHNLSYLCASTLAARNIELEAIENFLNPSLKKAWILPNQLPDMAKAIEKLKIAIKNKQTIGIIGDYDVDGICSSVLWKDLFDELNIKTFVWLPNRNDNYGPSQATLDFFTQNPVSLLLMVDCASNSHEFIQKAETKGFEMIIIDHHIASLDETTKKHSVINPHRNDINKLEQGELLSLCAAAISFLTACELLKNLAIEEKTAQNILKKLLDLVALATICDIMPMTQLNRALVSQGLKILEEQKRNGIKIMLQQSQIKFPLTSSDIGFYIGPRLNAAGRIKHSHLAFELLSTKSQDIAINLVNELENLNAQRKTIQEYAFQEACAKVEGKLDEASIICLNDSSWSPGIIGIIAAMLQEKFAKPAIIGTIQGNVIKASARSKLINIGNLIQKAALENIIMAGGGHHFAGGLSCTIDQWPIFTQWIEEQTKTIKITQREIIIDTIIDLLQIEKDYKKISPHGPKNEEIIILTKNTYIEKIFETDKYIKIYILQNFKTHTFFLQNKHKELIEQIKSAYMQNKKLNILIKLSEKGYHNIIDLEILN
jgi:single-stranded-DNA-specific exonuclease